MPLEILLLLAVFSTSFISGVIGMGGGSILMGVYLLFFSVEEAMVLHGFTQLVANFSRAVFLWDSIRWRLLPTYFIGIIPIVLIFYFFKLVPSKGLVYILLGLFPFISMGFRALKIFDLSIEKSFHAFLCGACVTVIQLTAGASGIVLTEFYIYSGLNRKEIVGTQSFTQSTAHLSKFIYFLLMLQLASKEMKLSWDLYPLIGAISILGTYFGKKILLRLSDKVFKKIAKLLIRGVALVFLFQGMRECGLL